MKKIVFLIFACLWIIISLLIIRSTYAKYLTSIDGGTNVNIAQWNLILNKQDILQNSDFSSTLSLKVPKSDYYIEDYMVPGATGYYDLIIDSSNVSLPFRFHITCSVAENSDIKDAKIIGYSRNGNSQITYLDDSKKEITDSVAETVDTCSVRVYVKWIDNDSSETMNDTNDTSVALNNGNAIITTNISFEQIT